MIDVIIPAYNNYDLIKNALASLSLQSISEKLNVYIVNDFSEKDYSEEISLYKDKLKIVELNTGKNLGPGYARQYGIDNSNSEFIVFLDSDDIFYSNFSLEDLYSNISSDDSDVVITNILEECPQCNIMIYNNNIWLHGKIYRREFLNKNNIRFNNSSSNEDTGFNTLVSICSNKIKYVDILTYIWKYNEDSITRKNNFEFGFYGLKGFIENICWAILEAEKLNQDKEKIAKVAYESIIEIYYNYIKYKNDKKSYLILDWSKKLKELYIKYKDYINKNNKFDIEYNIIQKCILIAETENILKNNISFYDFLDKII